MTRTPTDGFGRRTFLQVAATAGAAAVAGLAPSGVAHSAPPDHYPGRRPLDQGTIDAATASLAPVLVTLRRDLHAHPEVAGAESRTAALVADRLRAAGLRVTTGVGGHGVVGVLRGAHGGRTVAYRADLDAVPVGGTIGGSTGIAHLCGHDVHTAVGVGVAEVLSRFRSRIVGAVAFVFQPGEENLTGARAMLADGVLRRTGAQEIHALHCGPMPVGSLAVTPGFGMPGLDGAVARLTGLDAAARAEELAADVAALSTVKRLQSLEDIERLVSELGTPDGPLSRFVNVQGVSVTNPGVGSAAVTVSYRCWPEARFVEVRDRILGIARKYGAQVEFLDEPFPALVCPEREGYQLKRYLRRVIGAEQTLHLHAAHPYNGDDFAFFAHQLPVTYSFLGVRAPGAPVTTATPHHIDFEPDERAIGVGVRAMAGWLAQRARSPR